jgi:hypothetical protein
MFDYLKMSTCTTNFNIDLLTNPLLEFTTEVNDQTGELKTNIYKAKYRSFNILTYPSGRVEINGSIHKQFAGGANYSDFTIENLKSAIKELEKDLGIYASDLIIHNIEIGVNIDTPFKPCVLLDNLIVYKNSPFNTMRVIGRGHGKDIYKSHHAVKIYSKGLQYGLTQNRVRLEKKIFKMQSLKAGQITLHELLSPSFIDHCKAQLLQCIDSIIISEPIDLNRISKKHLRIYEECTNPHNWMRYDTQQRHHKRIQFSNIIKKYGLMQLKETTMLLVIDKLKLLTASKQKTYKVLTGVNNQTYKVLTL